MARTVSVTNAPADRLSLPEALVLLQARRQVDLLFKLWKAHGLVDESRSAKPWRVLTEVFAPAPTSAAPSGSSTAACAGCRLNPRKKHSTTYQLLLDPTLLALA